MRHDELHLWFLGNPQAPRLVGSLRLAAVGKGVSLRYDTQWLKQGFALSEDLPLLDTEWAPPGRLSADAPRAVGAVDDARPDRWGEKVIRFVDRPQRLSLMEYLYYAGDDRFGALGVSSSSEVYSPRWGGPLPRLDQAQQLSDIVSKIESAEPLTTLEARIIAGGGSPLGGAKPKALIEIDGEQWVIKFYNHEPVDSPLIEHASLTLARQAGITVAQTRVIRLTGTHALAIRRFDRVPGQRIHCISAGTAIRAAAASGAEPDLGYPELARILRRAGVMHNDTTQRDAQELFRRMVFNILIDNTDDHEKNHALLVVNPAAQGRLKLAPAYDVLPTTSGQGAQEFVCGAQGRESTLENALSHCEAFGLSPSQAAEEVARVLDVVNSWKVHFERCGVSRHDIELLAQTIDGPALQSQRQSFDPSVYSAAMQGRSKRTARRGPFGRG